MMAAIGVHFGNTSACVAVSKSGKVDVVANSHGDRLTPAMVTFLKDETLVGFAAKQTRLRHLQETVLHINQFLGKQMHDKQTRELMECRSLERVPISGNDDGSLVYTVKVGGKLKSYTPEVTAKMILQNVMETAQSQAGADVNEAVFTAPVGFLSTYRDALEEAASKAGFEVLRIISQPAAAAIAYGNGMEERTEEPYDVVVFRVGGITQDVTLLGVCNGIVSVKKHISRNSGGDVLTGDLANHFASLFEREFKASIRGNAKAMGKLMVQAEKCKHVLSTMPSASCHIDSLYDGMDFNGSISRSRFEVLVNEHLQGFITPMKDLLLDLDCTKIRKIILCGGTSSIPKLQGMISQLLPETTLLHSIPPSEVIAVGAAIEAGLLVGQNDLDLADEDCQMTLSPVNIYASVFDALKLLIKAHTPLPCSFDTEYAIPSGQKDCVVQLLFAQNAGKDETNQKLADIHLETLSPGGKIGVHAKYLLNGHLAFTCVDKTSGLTKSVTVSG